MHEEMITASDSFCTYDLGRYYTIIPSNPRWKVEEFVEANKVKVKEGFRYNSGKNEEWETVDSLRALIKEHVNPTLDPQID